jgi:two-component system, LytTR family, sensor kinase
LIENAIRHGMDSSFHVRIEITAECQGEFLYVAVRDHGPGIDDSTPLVLGIGLRNTTERLQRLYGDDEHRFGIRNAPEGGGTTVEIRVPFRSERSPATPSLVAESGVR